MNEQDRFKEIAKVAADATATIVVITRKLEGLEERNVIMGDLSDLAYQLGYIEGLSYVPEEGDEN